METTHEVPIFNAYHQKDLLLDLQDTRDKRIPNAPSNSKCASPFNNQSYVVEDPLLAVKLDPAVLEAQVTVGSSEARSHEVLNNTLLKGSNEGLNNTIASAIQKDVPFCNNKDAPVPSSDNFKTMLSMQREALRSLSTEQFDLLLKYVDTLRCQRVSVQKQLECAFCKRNGHPMTWYSSHTLRDSKGRVRCPVLRRLCCRLCGATGDHAHTVKYCSRNF